MKPPAPKEHRDADPQPNPPSDSYLDPPPVTEAAAPTAKQSASTPTSRRTNNAAKRPTPAKPAAADAKLQPVVQISDASEQPPAAAELAATARRPSAGCKTQPKSFTQLQLRRSPRVSTRLGVIRPANPPRQPTFEHEPAPTANANKSSSTQSPCIRNTSKPPCIPTSTTRSPSIDIPPCRVQPAISVEIVPSSSTPKYPTRVVTSSKNDASAEPPEDQNEEEEEVDDHEETDPTQYEEVDQDEGVEDETSVRMGQVDADVLPEETMPAPQVLSIRCKKLVPDEAVDAAGKKRKRRGTVRGAKLAALVEALGTKINVECSREANGPVMERI